MADPSSNPVQQALEAAVSGDAEAASRLLPLLYGELRGLARRLMANQPPGHTLQPTALVHEAYLRLIGKDGAEWEGRAHFFGAAARAMRDILVESARRKAALKRGGARKRVDVEPEALAVEGPRADDLLALDEALRKLEDEDPRKGRIVDLRFFAGLEMAEIAELLGVSEATVKRDWRYIRARLHKELSSGATAGG
jgi:RNA polymerase sigma factor (TIGR02999 family)